MIGIAKYQLLTNRIGISNINPLQCGIGGNCDVAGCIDNSVGCVDPSYASGGFGGLMEDFKVEELAG